MDGLPLKPSTARGPSQLLPRHLQLELNRHVLRKIARFCLHFHTLRLDVGKSTLGTVKNVTCIISRMKCMSFFNAALGWSLLTDVLFGKLICRSIC